MKVHNAFGEAPSSKAASGATGDRIIDPNAIQQIISPGFSPTAGIEKQVNNFILPDNVMTPLISAALLKASFGLVAYDQNAVIEFLVTVG